MSNDVDEVVQSLWDRIDLGPEADRLRGGTTIGEGDARRILAERMGWDYDSNIFGRGSDQNEGGLEALDLASALAKAMPEDYRNEAFLRSVDIRPLLQSLVGAEIEDFADSPDTLIVSGGPKSRGTKVITQAMVDQWLEAENERIRASLNDATVGSNLDDAERQRRIEAAMTYGTRVGLSPVVENTTAPGPAQTYVGGQTGEFTPESLVEGQASAGAMTFPVDDFRLMVSSGMWQLEQLINETAGINQQGISGFVPVELEDPRVVRDTPGGHGLGGVSTAMPQQLSPLGALNYLHTRPVEEVEAIQRKLAAAGFYDRLGEDGMIIDWGESRDPATMRAWAMLLEESIADKRSTNAILVDRARSYRADIRQQRMAALDPLDQDITRLNADDFAQSTIGRNLTEEEFVGLTRYLNDLRVQRASFVEGAVNEEGRLPNSLGFTESDVQGYIYGKTRDERRQDGMHSLAFQMNRMIGAID